LKGRELRDKIRFEIWDPAASKAIPLNDKNYREKVQIFAPSISEEDMEIYVQYGQ